MAVRIKKTGGLRMKEGNEDNVSQVLSTEPGTSGQEGTYCSGGSSEVKAVAASQVHPSLRRVGKPTPQPDITLGMPPLG